ncbi:triose-phosphate isomerase [Patescibacteria group bacterium]|nr:triose-phosphate isomerase [Patescibacteria group bacterium]
MILLNFKLYKQTFADSAIKLASTVKEVMAETGVKIIPVVSALDAVRIREKLDIDVYLQHVDLFSEGPHTGYISISAAKALGIKGSLINHSEHRLKPGIIKGIVKSCPPDFDLVLCLQTFGQLTRWGSRLKPSYFAYEPKEFIGNPDISVATARPEQIKNFSQALNSSSLLVGAGISTPQDVSASLKLGATGILVASSVIKSADPKKALLALASSFSV